VKPDGRTAKAEEQVQTASDDRDLLVCRCEEITLGEILAAIDEGITTPSGLKRRLRIGMGLCQGRTCRLLLTRVLAERLGVKHEDIVPATFRPPVRPVTLAALADERDGPPADEHESTPAD
jgi:NAD(P)H-nitrite reductase large subunit